MKVCKMNSYLLADNYDYGYTGVSFEKLQLGNFMTPPQILVKHALIFPLEIMSAILVKSMFCDDHII